MYQIEFKVIGHHEWEELVALGTSEEVEVFIHGHCKITNLEGAYRVTPPVSVRHPLSRPNISSGFISLRRTGGEISTLWLRS